MKCYAFPTQLCEDVNKQEGVSANPYACVTTEHGTVGYLHRGPLKVRGDVMVNVDGSGDSLSVGLATIEESAVAALALVTCSFSGLNPTVNPSTLVPHFLKAVMDHSSTERILCLVDFNSWKHSSCKLFKMLPHACKKNKQTITENS